jgi:hypothetical protein
MVYKMTKLDIKLKWNRNTEESVSNIAHMPIAYEVWESTYKDFYIKIYPVTLIYDCINGYEYEIKQKNKYYNSLAYSSLFDKKYGHSHAKDHKEAMEWAEHTLNNILNYGWKILRYKMVKK